MSSTPQMERQPSAWQNAFNQQTRRQQMQDDTVAFQRVTGIIITIVSLGLLLGIASVILSA